MGATRAEGPSSQVSNSQGTKGGTLIRDLGAFFSGLFRGDLGIQGRFKVCVCVCVYVYIYILYIYIKYIYIHGEQDQGSPSGDPSLYPLKQASQ